METIKVSVDVNVNFSESAMTFIKSMFAVVPTCNCGCNIVAEKKHTVIIDDFSAAPKNQEQAKEFMEKVISGQPAKPAKPAEVPEEPAAPAKAVSRSIEDVRAALAEKVNDHRETIKAKLTEFGAPSVTKLDPASYKAMYDFLKAL